MSLLKKKKRQEPNKPEALDKRQPSAIWCLEPSGAWNPLVPSDQAVFLTQQTLGSAESSEWTRNLCQFKRNPKPWRSS